MNPATPSPSHEHGGQAGATHGLMLHDALVYGFLALAIVSTIVVFVRYQVPYLRSKRATQRDARDFHGSPPVTVVAMQGRRARDE